MTPLTVGNGGGRLSRDLQGQVPGVHSHKQALRKSWTAAMFKFLDFILFCDSGFLYGFLPGT